MHALWILRLRRHAVEYNITGSTEGKYYWYSTEPDWALFIGITAAIVRESATNKQKAASQKLESKANQGDESFAHKWANFLYTHPLFGYPFIDGIRRSEDAKLSLALFFKSIYYRQKGKIHLPNCLKKLNV